MQKQAEVLAVWVFIQLMGIFWTSTVCCGEGNGNPLQYSCLENPMDRGARWAIVYGVARVRHSLVTKSPTVCWALDSKYIYMTLYGI